MPGGKFRDHTLTLTLIVLLAAPSSAQFIQQGSKLIGVGGSGPLQGYSVSLSGDGNTAIVGGPYDSYSQGGAWIFQRSGGVWTQQGGKLMGTGAIGEAKQGYAVSISADGNTAIVGGPGDNSALGAAWIFTRAGEVWTQQGDKLVGTGAVVYSDQGASVSISGDGNTVLVGGFGDDHFAGAAWVFTRDEGVWTQQGEKLVGTGAVGSAQQGISVSLSSDGTTALVGGRWDEDATGAVWVYAREGGVWTQQGEKLVGAGTVGECFQGESVSLSADGNTAMVGGILADSGVGGAWIFTRTAGLWAQQGGKLEGTGAIGHAFQGKSVCLSADGNMAIMGGYFDNSQTGAAWAFVRSDTVWSQFGNRIVGTGAVGSSSQGRSVSLSSNGSTAIVGGSGDNFSHGAAWVYVSQTTGVDEGQAGRPGFRLHTNYPNPFNPETRIGFSIPRPAHVSLTVYDMLGREVCRLVRGFSLSGEYTTAWKADGVPGGVYFYRLVAGDFTDTKKMVLMK